MRKRLDTLLVERGIVTSRQKAKAYIICGNISVNGETVRKPATLIEEEASLELHLNNNGYVSRGGIKLEGALRDFKVEVNGTFCLDIGASKGGFTDCLLQNGARRVIAIDVGKNQIDYRLRCDPRISVVEGFNARFIDQYKINEHIDIVTIDVSFISLRRIVLPLLSIIDENTLIIALIKPQFELDRPYRGFRGVVGDPALRVSILKSLDRFFFSAGYQVMDYAKSQIRGPKGNEEYFVLLNKGLKKGAQNNRINLLNREKHIEEIVYHGSK